MSKLVNRVLAGSLMVAGTVATNASVADGAAGSAYSFTLEPGTGSHSIASFSELQGITTKVDVVEYEGSRELMLRSQPEGAVVSLKDASIKGGELESWWKQSASSKKIKKTLVLGLWDHLAGPKAKAKRRCEFTLHGATIRGFKKRAVVRNGKKIQVADVELAPARISHDCEELFRHPRDRKRE